jgi:hypothetical protein
VPNQHTRSELLGDSKRLVAKSFHLKTKSDEIIDQALLTRRTVPKAATQGHTQASVFNRSHFIDKIPDGQSSMERHSGVLNSWKEIAAYLDRGIRTVQRWERELQLPVRRPRQKARSAVLAFRSELDRWLLNANANCLAETPTDDPASELARLERKLQRLQIEIQTVQNQIKKIKNRVPGTQERCLSAENRAAVA